MVMSELIALNVRLGAHKFSLFNFVLLLLNRNLLSGFGAAPDALLLSSASETNSSGIL